MHVYPFCLSIICLSNCLIICLCIYQSNVVRIHLRNSNSVKISVLNISVCVPFCLSVSLSLYSSFYLSIDQSVCQSIYLTVYLNTCLFTYLSISLSIHSTIHRSCYVCIYPSVVCQNTLTLRWYQQIKENPGFLITAGTRISD